MKSDDDTNPRAPAQPIHVGDPFPIGARIAREASIACAAAAVQRSTAECRRRGFVGIATSTGGPTIRSIYGRASACKSV